MNESTTWAQMALDLSGGRCDTIEYPNGRPTRCSEQATTHTVIEQHDDFFIGSGDGAGRVVCHQLDQCDRHAAAVIERFAGSRAIVRQDPLVRI